MSFELSAQIADRNVPHNEFVPTGEIVMTLNPHSIKNAFVFQKIYPLEDFSFNIDKNLKYLIYTKPIEISTYERFRVYNASGNANRFSAVSYNGQVTNNNGYDDSEEEVSQLFAWV